MKLVIIIPLYNDWKSVFLLVKKIQEELEKEMYSYEVLIVNDGSSEMPDDNFSLDTLRKQISIKVLSLTCNLGHQRSISIGIAHVHNNYEFSHIVVLDGDGEDKPHGINLLIESCQNSKSTKIIFAEREKKQNQKAFFYFIYFISSFLKY
jgi:glycosyltransferase involved in cell wall biosynthesis